MTWFKNSHLCKISLSHVKMNKKMALLCSLIINSIFPTYFCFLQSLLHLFLSLSVSTWLLFANSTPAKYKNGRLWGPLRGTLLWCWEEITEWVREWGIERKREWKCVYISIYCNCLALQNTVNTFQFKHDVLFVQKQILKTTEKNM